MEKLLVVQAINLEECTPGEQRLVRVGKIALTIDLLGEQRAQCVRRIRRRAIPWLIAVIIISFLMVALPPFAYKICIFPLFNVLQMAYAEIVNRKDWQWVDEIKVDCEKARQQLLRLEGDENSQFEK